jgi:hypothetical protein
MRHKLGCVMLVAALAGTGCGGAFYMEMRPEHFYEKWPTEDVSYRKVGDLEVRLRGFTFFGWPTAIPNLVSSVESEIQAANADAVTNLEVETRINSVMLFFASSIYTARGDLIVFE